MENIFKNLNLKLYIGGKFVEGVKGQKIKIINPADEKLICEVSEATEEDAEIAILSARKGFEEWSKVSLDERVKLLNLLADKIRDSAEELALLESLDNGKPYLDSLEDIYESNRCLRYYAGFADKILGTSITTYNNNTIHVRRIPYGIVGCIVPWNYPFLMAAWKIFPALAAGNAVVLKPSEETPLTALK